ncbi:sugar ABC transporter ATP-binding protein [Piscinibacter gummiphilus]|uniref:Sugar ABC transporter ATP-binding protein n=1 Tax=Piscinibacter gummiphilus TaxID=946333 RepID=A0ABZ0CSQ0_9BURK|nr:sugar ABC transporter ATP-binding protein [Piscinibacter gummiphilus]WOB06116.1 sugar ABC transporter ATP-binding protein [Piscinibacter gummiphilus]
MSLHVRFAEITKDFGPVRVLHGVSFELQPGRVYGLLGENGAGKSTLMKILSGYEAASGGELFIDGKPCRFAGSRDAESAGVVLIHQEFNLADDLTIAQNIFLGRELRRGLWLDDAAMREASRRVLEQVGLQVDPGRRVGDLIVAEKQLVEIAKALARQARLLVMDEPTATLTPSETQSLFALIAQLKASGVTILYISHKLDEVERITDEVLVMRDGRLVAREPTAGLSRQRMANLMVGRELSDMFPERRAAPQGEPLLRVQGLSVPGWAQGVSFEVRPGEILGFAGLVGAGRTELFEGLLGLRPVSAGEVEIEGRAVRFRNPREALQHGVAYLSEDRKGKGLHVAFPLYQNLTLMNLASHAKPLLDSASEQAALKKAIADFGIRGNPQSRASALSGGNQQKLAIAKVLQPDPRVVVLDEPTRGVDVGAKREIYFLIQKLADEGRAVVVISSELMELIGLCHRVAVMRAGHLQATLAADHLTEEELIAHATGTH